MTQGKRVGLTRDKVLDAALELVDRDGAGGLTMRKLGAALDVEAMTLYHYFANKDAVLDGLVERVASAARPRLPTPPGDWREWARAFAHDFRAELLRHPGVVPLVAVRPVRTPGGLRAAEDAAAALTAAGYPPTTALHIVNTVATYVIGHALAELPMPGDGPLDLDPAEYPVLCAAVAAGLGTPTDHAARFAFGLDALLAGIAPAGGG